MYWKSSIHKSRAPSAVERVALKSTLLALKMFVRELLRGNPPPHMFHPFSVLVRNDAISSEDDVEPVVFCWLQSAE